MGRRLFVFGVLLLATVCFVGSSLAWQGRMAGMGDPYGLLEDESDFLIHPAMIADGKGVNYYGHFGFQYRDVSDWSYNFTLNPSSIRALGRPIADLPLVRLKGGYNGSGDEQFYDATGGIAFPLGSGRMGFFFNYKGKRGDYDGSGLFAGSLGTGNGSIKTSYDMDSSMDSFAGRFIYGLPLGASLNFGSELEIAYHQAENSTSQRLTNILLNGQSFKPLLDLTDTNGFLGTLSPFMFPYDSSYFEITPKVGVSGGAGPVKWGTTVRGGAIFGGDNTWESSQMLRVNPGAVGVDIGTFGASHTFDLEGDVSGWKVGGDFWLRYALNPNMNLPFLLRIDYKSLSRDGQGTGLVFAGTNGGNTLVDGFPLRWDYDQEETSFEIETGAGLEYMPNKGTLIAGGLYYKYINTEQTMSITPSVNIGDVGNDLLSSVRLSLPSAFDPAPEITEHQVIFRMAAETQINPCFVLRGGLKTFYGWVDEDFNLSSSLSPTGLSILKSTNSLSGGHWGILGAIGSTFNFASFAIEPYIQGGYELYNPDGTGRLSLLDGVASARFDVDKEREDTFIGVGLSVRF